MTTYIDSKSEDSYTDSKSSFEQPLLEQQNTPKQSCGRRVYRYFALALLSGFCLFSLFVPSFNIPITLDLAGFETSDEYTPSSSPFFYDGATKHSAVACVDFSPPNDHPKFLKWLENNSDGLSHYEMVEHVYNAVFEAWTAHDESKKTLHFQNSLTIRLTESNNGKYDNSGSPHLDEAIIQTLQLQGPVIPDAACVFGHDSDGARLAFVWGYDERKVEKTVCSTTAEEKYCVTVGRDYFDLHADDRN